MLRSTFSFSSSISRMSPMRLRRSMGSTVSSRSCFSSTGSWRLAAIGSERRAGAATRRGGLDARVQEANGGAKETFLGGDGQRAGALDTFDQDFNVAVGQLDALHDV